MTNDDNDKTPPFGVPRLPARSALDDPPDVIDPDLGVTERDLNLFDAYHYELGVMAGEDPRPNTPEEQAIEAASWADAIEMMSKSPEEVRAQQAERRRRARR